MAQRSWAGYNIDSLQPRNERSDTNEPAEEESLMRLLESTNSLEDEDQYEKILDDILIVILDKGKDFFVRLRAETANAPPNLDLLSALTPSHSRSS